MTRGRGGDNGRSLGQMYVIRGGTDDGWRGGDKESGCDRGRI